MRRKPSTKGPLLLLGILYAIPAAMAGVMLFFGIRDTQMALIVGGGVGLVFVGSSYMHRQAPARSVCRRRLRHRLLA